jgi:spore germination protein GerM
VAPVRQAVLELMVGPAPAERARGFSDALPRGARADRVRTVGGVVEIDLAGPEPTFLGAAAIVYSATSVPGVRAVRLLRYGKPCCVYLHSGAAMAEPHTKESFRGWSAGPCVLRTYAHALRCRGRRRPTDRHGAEGAGSFGVSRRSRG